ncbi:hypothetical protein [Stieleria neptunia]|nr:hypothetical protein [Stieleria neptunia]
MIVERDRTREAIKDNWICVYRLDSGPTKDSLQYGDANTPVRQV